MKVLGLGEVTEDEQSGWYYSKPMAVRMFGGKEWRIVLEGYDDDHNKEEFHRAIASFLSGAPSVLREADEPLFRYYKDFEEYWIDDGKRPIESADVLWQHVQLGSEPIVTRNPHDDHGVFVTIECGCDWEDEHGLQLVLKDGLKVSKLGPYDGHLTNTAAYNRSDLAGVIYKSLPR